MSVSLAMPRQRTMLPGDRTGGAVNAADLVLTRNRIGRSTANPGSGAGACTVFNDVNGDGTINASDLVLVRNRVGTGLPVQAHLVLSAPTVVINEPDLSHKKLARADGRVRTR